MGYIQLTQGQRYQIEGFLRIKMKRAEIARQIGVHRSTVSREIGRNCPLTEYRGSRAIGLARRRHREKRKRGISQETFERVDELLRQQWSPEQISGRLKLEGKQGVSHETIYHHVYRDRQEGGDLYKHLRRQHRYRKRINKYHKRGFREPRRPISERPVVVAERARIGDWEVDTIIGSSHRQAMVSLVERKSLYCLLEKLPNKSAQAVAEAVGRKLLPIDDLVLTITSDNGPEFALHKVIADTLGADFFFADPYSSWQRGTNENTNGLVRQYFPKRSDFSRVPDHLVDQVNYRLNNRPRKTLGFRTPAEVLFNQNVALIT